MKHYYENISGLGNIAVSRHAQDRMREEGVSEKLFQDVLEHGKDIDESAGIISRNGKGIRIVIITNPIPFRGAKLVKTVYKVQGQAKAL
jgi:hypothetical protein